MGGLIALNFVLRHPDRVAAAAIWNANFSAGLLGRLAQAILAWERFRLGSDVPVAHAAQADLLRLGRRRSPTAAPTSTGCRATRPRSTTYVADPLCGWDASVSMWSDIFQLVFTGADDRNFAGVRKDLPFNLVGGEHDPATDQAARRSSSSPRACAGWVFRISFQRFIPRPATKASTR